MEKIYGALGGHWEQRGSPRVALFGLFLAALGLLGHFGLGEKPDTFDDFEEELAAAESFVPGALLALVGCFAYNVPWRSWSYRCLLLALLALACAVGADAVHAMELHLQAYFMYISWVLATVALALCWKFQEEIWQRGKGATFGLRNATASALGCAALAAACSGAAALGRLTQLLFAESVLPARVFLFLFAGCTLVLMPLWAWSEDPKHRPWSFAGFFLPFIWAAGRTLLRWHS